MNNHARRVYDSMLGLCSSAENPTPLVRLNRVVPFDHAVVYAKLEWYNPFGSVKDRIAVNMISAAEARGDLKGGRGLVEPTSGNTGLGLTMAANSAGTGVTAVVSNRIPVEKRTMLRFFGADVIELDDDLCPAPGAPEGAIARARELGQEPGRHMLDQYRNVANPDAHFRSTGPEIWRQTEGEVTHFVAGLGTCGTIAGTGRYLKEQNPGVRVIGVHPSEGHDIPGVRSLVQLRQTEFFEPEEYDGLVEIGNEDAYDLALRLNREESIVAGPSSAMALAGALAAIPDEPGISAVVIFPDNAFKYASSVVNHLSELVTPAPAVTSKTDKLLDEMMESTRANPDKTIDVDSAHELWQDNGIFVLDVRDAKQFQAQHLPGAVNIPLYDLPERIGELPIDRHMRVLTICQRGNLSLGGVLVLNSLGFDNARSVDGGTEVWASKGYAVESA